MEVRERILNVATQEFLEKGFTHATTRAIARRAGTSESSLFRYFDSKYDLLAAVLKNGWQLLTEFAKPNVEGAVAYSPLEALCNIGAKMLQFYKEHPDLGVLLLSESWVLGPSSIALNKSVASAFLSDETKDFVGLIDELIQHGQQSGEIEKRLSATAIREAFFGLVEGLSFGWYLATHTEYQASYSLDEAVCILHNFINCLKVIGNDRRDSSSSLV